MSDKLHCPKCGGHKGVLRGCPFCAYTEGENNLEVKILWRACAEGRWKTGEDATTLDASFTPDDVESIIDDDGGTSRWVMVHMPNFHAYYSIGTNPVNYKITGVKAV